ncbi:2-oxoacid:acceptor oxidoreductase family protein [Natroniella sp. ANB-PHB2]|uniref:2-oxoacid:acceptor oxidoreductase family protein n=1 Tax=Natroniella sp. ANB-PHB2 TaxID=3384444 RepID=UPI0038D4F40B
MIKEEIIMAGFGGQGVMLMGKLLAYSGMKEGKEVSWIPSYGPEMRGGTANCTVIVSDEKVAAPVVDNPTTAIVMNRPSLMKFGPKVKAGGYLFINSSLIEESFERDDINIIEIPANKIADQLENTKIANLVMLGAFLEEMDLVDYTIVNESISDILPEHRQNLVTINQKALAKGKDLI